MARSPYASFKTANAAYRAGYTQAELSRSPVGRDLLRRAESTLVKRRATIAYHHSRAYSERYAVIVKVTLKSPTERFTRFITVEHNVRPTNEQLAEAVHDMVDDWDSVQFVRFRVVETFITDDAV